MDATAFRKEERVGLTVAVVLHLLLFAGFLLQPSRDEVFEMPERMTVSLAEDVGLEATAPDPVTESRAAIAPTLSEQPTPLAEPLPTPPEPSVRPEPRPVTQPQPTVRPQPAPRRTSAPTPRDTPAPAPAPRPTQASGGGSRIGNDFLGGAGSSTSTTETRVPASQIGASAKASLRQAISRQIKPHWSAPQGADAELLVTILAFRLNEDGSLAGRPRVVSQSGINAANKAQADLHAERAVRAVQLAAPFDLPPEYYNAWKNISEWRFDRRL